MLQVKVRFITKEEGSGDSAIIVHSIQIWHPDDHRWDLLEVILPGDLCIFVMTISRRRLAQVLEAIKSDDLDGAGQDGSVM